MGCACGACYLLGVVSSCVLQDRALGKLPQLQEHGVGAAMYHEGVALEKLSVLQELDKGPAHKTQRPDPGEATRAERAY